MRLRSRGVFLLLGLLLFSGVLLFAAAGGMPDGRIPGAQAPRTDGGLDSSVSFALDGARGSGGSQDGAKALSVIFIDGFESGDTSVWSAPPPTHCPVPTMTLP